VVVRHAAFVAFAGLALLGREPGCGGVDSPAGTVNAPCTRDKDCRDGLGCREGVCAEPDAGVTTDAGAGDAAAKDAARDGA